MTKGKTFTSTSQSFIGDLFFIISISISPFLTWFSIYVKYLIYRRVICLPWIYWVAGQPWFTSSWRTTRCILGHIHIYNVTNGLRRRDTAAWNLCLRGWAYNSPISPVSCCIKPKQQRTISWAYFYPSTTFWGKHNPRHLAMADFSHHRHRSNRYVVEFFVERAFSCGTAYYG
jgi:hypothetical protein